MTFNQELIAKARKGEIAILNDGSVGELRKVLSEIWPDDISSLIMGCDKFYRKIAGENHWIGCQGTNLPAHSVKDFFMTEPIPLKEIMDDIKIVQPRTYKVTRSQMKEIWEAMNHPGGKLVIRNIISEQFDELENEAEITEGTIQRLEALPDIGAILRSIFPAYFYIPEGEPVLVRNRNDEGEPFKWYIRVSDGKGGSYIEGKTSGISTKWHETIAYTKNPPK